MKKSDLITDHHLTRKALIYIRQSSPHQQISNQESVRLQYALKQRAIELGWQERDIEIVDCDLGLSGSATTHREGFKEMLARVALGEIGILLSYEVDRICRNCTDWYPVLDICGYQGCLIADVDGIYDPASRNGRMILGLKGQISELELYTIQNRLVAGLESKAARGELAQALPIGLVRDREGKVHKHPDLEVQRRIELVFDTFLRVGSASKVMRFFQENNLLLPRQNDNKDIHWIEPSVDAIIATLKQPAYAGAFVRGKTKMVRKKSDPTQKIQKHLPLEEWKHLVKDKYPKYISWETYEKVRAKLKDNHAEYDRNKSRGIAREGAVMLHGIAYCGECGHKMVVQYKGGNQYQCNALRQRRGVPVCQRIPGDPIDAVVIKAFFQAASPIELDAYEKALEKQKQLDEKVNNAHKQQIQRLQYREKLARRQYDNSDPENRLVTSELEKRWEDALWELKKAQEESAKQKEKQQTPSLSPETKELFTNIGKKLPEIWKTDLLDRPKKKELLRALIDKAVMHRIAQDKVQLRIIWRGGANTNFQIPINVGSFEHLSSAKEMEQIIISMHKEGKSDEEVTEHLNSLGYRSPRKDFVLVSTVRAVRLRHGLMKNPNLSHPRDVEGYLTITQIAKTIDVQNYWIYDRINNGTINVEKDSKTGLYLFPDTSHTIKKFRKLKNGKVKKLRF